MGAEKTPIVISSRRRPLAVCVAAVVAIAAATACGTPSQDRNAAELAAKTVKASGGTPADGPTIRVGVNDPDQRVVAVLEYLPANVTVAAGQTVTWTWDGTIEPHSVTFFPPGQTAPPPGSDRTLFGPTSPPAVTYDGTALVNSGLAPLGPQAVAPFQLSFSRPGTYTYSCVIHPQMVGTVTVVGAGGAVESAGEVKARGDREAAQWLAEGRAALQQLVSAPPASTRNPDGTTTWRIPMGASTPHTDILAFAPVPQNVRPGDAVIFVNGSGAPHTATFFGTQPPIMNPLDPRVEQPAPGPSPQPLNGRDLFNTGLVPPDAPPGAAPPEAARSFTFVVPAAGEFPYVCILHAPSGMGGVIKAS